MESLDFFVLFFKTKNVKSTGLEPKVTNLSEVSTLKASAPTISQPQVVKWVEEWWTNSGTPMKITAADEFSRGCKTFLTLLVVGSIQKQSGEMANLVARVDSLSVANVPSAGTAPPVAQSTFTALQQSLGMGGTIPLASIPPTANAASSGWKGMTSAEIQVSQAATIALLEARVKCLDAKFNQLTSNKASTTMRFGGADVFHPKVNHFPT
jgi:hypothetical protein